MNSEHYEGYSNQETWAVCLSLNNTEFMYKTSKGLLAQVKRLAKRKGREHDHLTTEQFIVRCYAESLEKYVKTHIELFEKNNRYDKDIMMLVHNLIGLHRVDWKEVAEDQMAK